MPRSMQRGDVDKTAIIECRCDVRLLKTVLDHLNKVGYPVYTKSDLVATAVRLAANTLVDGGLVEECVSFEEAHMALSVFRKTRRDKRAEMHLSAVVNERDMIAGKIDQQTIDVGITPDMILDVTRRVEEAMRGSVLSEEAKIIPDMSGDLLAGLGKDDMIVRENTIDGEKEN